MKFAFSLLGFLIITISATAQFRTDEWGDIIPYSVGSTEIDSLKIGDKINTITLPPFDNDSLYWAYNAEIMMRAAKSSRPGLTRSGGFVIDTVFNFFNEALKIKIEDGYLWFLKIFSPTAGELSVVVKKYSPGENEYLTGYTNMWDTIDGPYSLYGYDVITSTKNPRYIRRYSNSPDSVFTFGYLGNELYLEYFTKKEYPEDGCLIIKGILYSWPFSQPRIPEWLEQKYPDFDFRRGRFKDEQKKGSINNQ